MPVIHAEQGSARKPKPTCPSHVANQLAQCSVKDTAAKTRWQTMEEHNVNLWPLRALKEKGGKRSITTWT